MDITIVGPTGMPAAGFANVRAALGGGGGGGAARNAYRTGMQGVAALPRNVAINNDAAGNAIADA